MSHKKQNEITISSSSYSSDRHFFCLRCTKALPELKQRFPAPLESCSGMISAVTADGPYQFAARRVDNSSSLKLVLLDTVKNKVVLPFALCLKLILQALRATHLLFEELPSLAIDDTCMYTKNLLCNPCIWYPHFYFVSYAVDPRNSCVRVFLREDFSHISDIGKEGRLLKYYILSCFIVNRSVCSDSMDNLEIHAVFVWALIMFMWSLLK